MRTFKDTVSIHTQYLKTESVWRHNNPPPHQLYAGIISLSLPLSYLRIYGRFSPCIFMAVTFEVIFESLNMFAALLWLMSSLFLHKIGTDIQLIEVNSICI